MGTGKPDLGRFLVEWYGHQVSAGAIGGMAGRLRDGAESSSAAGAPVRLLVGISSPTDDYAFGVFAAESADTLRQLCLDADAPPDRISSVMDWFPTSGADTQP
jgi:hypothetical protein